MQNDNEIFNYHLKCKLSLNTVNMRVFWFQYFASAVLAARPFMNEVDTGSVQAVYVISYTASILTISVSTMLF